MKLATNKRFKQLHAFFKLIHQYSFWGGCTDGWTEYPLCVLQDIVPYQVPLPNKQQQQEQQRQ